MFEVRCLPRDLPFRGPDKAIAWARDGPCPALLMGLFASTSNQHGVTHTEAPVDLPLNQPTRLRAI